MLLNIVILSSFLACRLPLTQSQAFLGDSCKHHDNVDSDVLMALRQLQMEFTTYRMDTQRELQGLNDRLRKVEAELDEIKSQPDKTEPMLNDTEQHVDSSNGCFGKEFLLTFPEGYGNITKLQINIVSLDSATVQLSSPLSGVNQSISVEPSTGKAVNVPTSLVQASLIKENKYVMVTSDNDISVTVVEYIPGHSSDGYLAIPTYMANDRYICISNEWSIMSLVAIHDDTNVLIRRLKGGYLKSTNGIVNSISLTLSRLQTYQVKCHSYCQVKINGSSPFLFLYGSYIASGYSSYTTSYLEQIIPPSNLSSFTFIVPMLSLSSEQIVFCFGDSNINITSGHITTLYGSFAVINKFQTSKYITTNQSAICVYEGHGFSTIIPPVTLYTNYFRFLTPSVTTFTHHAAVMVLTSNKDGIRVDQTLPTIAKQETVVVQSTSYSVLYLNITSGQHDITHVDPSVSFGVILYGFGVSGTGSYAYPGGFKFT